MNVDGQRRPDRLGPNAAVAIFLLLVGGITFTGLTRWSATAPTTGTFNDVVDVGAAWVGTNSFSSPFRGRVGHSQRSSVTFRYHYDDAATIARLGGADFAPRALATGSGEAVFWSGVRGGDSTAASWASKHGGATLESTLAQRGIRLPAWDPSNPASVAAWRNASAEFAAGARGHVRVLQGDAVRVNSVWAQVEYPALKANPNVTGITAVNPQTGAEVLLWSR